MHGINKLIAAWSLMIGERPANIKGALQDRFYSPDFKRGWGESMVAWIVRFRNLRARLAAAKVDVGGEPQAGYHLTKKSRLSIEQTSLLEVGLGDKEDQVDVETQLQKLFPRLHELERKSPSTNPGKDSVKTLTKANLDAWKAKFSAPSK